MPSLTNKPFIPGVSRLNVIPLNVIRLSVVAPAFNFYSKFCLGTVFGLTGLSGFQSYLDFKTSRVLFETRAPLYASSLAIYVIRGLYYKTFYDSNLLVFVIR
jgi:hypothetical protein